MKKRRPPAAAAPPTGGEWSPEDVPALARGEGIAALCDRHWKVIATCREEAARTGRPPGQGRLEALTGLDADALEQLFPGDVESIVARIAGLTARPRHHGGPTEG